MRHVIATQLFTLLAPLAFVCCGCGEAPLPGSNEPQKVSAVVSALNDAASSDESFQTMFLSGSAPADRSPYYSAAIEIVSEPTVNGNEAQAQVKISQGGAVSEGNDRTKAETVNAGEVTWTLQKEGEEWKLKDAPLP